MNVAGGTHHVADQGEGFCLLNNFTMANYLPKKLAARILIIDLDVHQGNGTAKLFEKDERVFTFSMHGRHNYPFHKEKSDLDIGLEDGTNDATYLSLLRHNLPELINKTNPEFAFFLSGVDILDTDKFGKLKISPAGCKQRDEFVFSQLKQHAIPCVVYGWRLFCRHKNNC
jgi:acetoin utilization deacetylase AcuC-like enzyme